MQIILIKEYNEQLYKSINQLLPQLSSDATISIEQLQKLIDSKNNFLFVAQDENNKIVAMATLVCYNVPTGQKAWIEDVVVDNSCRGKGMGKKIIQFLLNFAKEKGIKKIDLTSSYTRKEANLLYQKLGFEQRKSNLYRYIFD